MPPFARVPMLLCDIFLFLARHAVDFYHAFLHAKSLNDERTGYRMRLYTIYRWQREDDHARYV